MTVQDSLDRLIRDTLSDSLTELEPGADVRSSLLAKAAAQAANWCETPEVGTSIPPLANDLRVSEPVRPGPQWRGHEPEFIEIFGSTQQKLVTVWMMATQSRY